MSTAATIGTGMKGAHVPAEMTMKEIEFADYSTLVAIVKERNRPSGGIQTIAEFACKGFIRPGKTVLEVGSNTGFAMVNLAALTGARCIGIDINPDSVAESEAYAKASGVDELTEFKVGSALSIPFDSGYFDAIWISNVTSFIRDKKAAFREYLRVLKPNGIVGFAPIYYVSPPPSGLLHRVEELVGCGIDVRTLEEWKTEIFKSLPDEGRLVEYSCTNFRYIDQSAKLESWVDGVLDKPHIMALSPDVRAVLRRKYHDAMSVFNQNLGYCGFSLVLYQLRPIAEEPELFLSRRADAD